MHCVAVAVGGDFIPLRNDDGGRRWADLRAADESFVIWVASGARRTPFRGLGEESARAREAN